jgi:hypothetical protein
MSESVEIAVRPGFFGGILLAMALWELPHPTVA